MIYDCAVIGSGPAGLEAVINLKIHNKTYIWFGSERLSDKIALAEKVENYPGFPAVSGKDLVEAFKAHKQAMGLEITEAIVNQVFPMGDCFALMAGSDYYQAKTVILTTGISMRNTIAGESQFLGRGVSYCATCDGGLYKGKTIAVVCNAKRLESEVNFLASLAGKVYFLPQYKNPEVTGDNIEVIKGKIKEIQGTIKVESIQMLSGETYPIDGIFCIRDSIALANLLSSIELEEGHIKVNRSMETSVKGVYAAGDCTGRPYQFTKAVGEGNVASLAAIEYLDSMK